MNEIDLTPEEEEKCK
jgi:Ca2+-binding EF-hand superfamily protein